MKTQIELLDINDPKSFAQCWNETIRMKRQIRPFVSKNGLLFTVSNAVDNMEFLGLSYIKKNRELLPSLVFLVEIMNFLFDKVEDCFYVINDDCHIYHNGLDTYRLMHLAKESDYDLNKLMIKSSAFDRDCNPDLPIEVVADWGSAISLFCVCQERNYDFVNNRTNGRKCQNFINEFYVKPYESNNILIKELCQGKIIKIR